MLQRRLELELEPEPRHPYDAEPRVAAILAPLEKLKVELAGLLKLERSRRDVLPKARAIRQARQDLDHAREAARVARLAEDTHALDERKPAYLQRGIALLEQLAEWTAGIDDLVALGLDRGTAAEWRFPFPLLLPEHADRLQRALAGAAHKNGRVCVRLLRSPAELKGKPARQFHALTEDERHALPSSERGWLREWPYRRLEKSWWSAPVAKRLVELGLGELFTDEV